MKHFQLSRLAITKLVASLIVLIIVIASAGAIFAFNHLSALGPAPAPIAIDLIEAVADNLVEATVSGDGLEKIEVTLKSTSNDSLEVSIPCGTIFGAQSTGVQNMVVIEEKVLYLKSRDSVVSDIIDVACAVMELSVPDVWDAFNVSMVPAPEDLIKLLNVPGFSNETFRVKQFAIWTITDNPSKGEYVGLGYFGSGTGPSWEEMNKIETLFENAGISTEKYRALNPAAPTPSPTPELTWLPILSSSSYTDTGGYFCVVGEVRNNLSSNIENVKIVATFYDSGNTVIGTDYTFTHIDILKPNQKSPFELSSYPDEITPSRYELTVDRYHLTSDQSFEGLAILSNTPSVYGSSGYHKIVGEVKNNGAEQAESVKVICTYYDSAGTVIGTYRTYVDTGSPDRWARSDIDAGGKAPFELIYWDRANFTPANYELQVEGW